MNSRRFLAIGVIGLLVLFIAWLLRDAVYQYLFIPIQYALWLGKVVYLTVPHILLWLAFLALTFILAFRSLYRRTRPFDALPPHIPRRAELRISLLARYIARRRRPFYQHRIKFVLTELALQVLTQKKRITLQEARALINRQELDAPPEVQSYLKDGLMPWSYGSLQSAGLFQQLFRRRKEKEADDLSMQVLNYIEEQMEIEKDGNSPSL